MCFKNATIILFCFLTFNLFSQILVDDVGDGWKSQVDSALSLIEKTSPEHWSEIKQYCNHITFWIGDFSTTIDTATVMISTRDMKIGSVNNLACIIVHEVHHLYILKTDRVLKPEEEELICYLWENEFLKKLPGAEEWLKRHLIKCILIYSEKEKETQN